MGDIEVAGALILDRRPGDRVGRAPDLTQLRPRDRELLSLLAEGLTTAAIASSLHVTPKAVRNRLSELFARLGVSSRAEAIVIARDAGFGGA